MRTLVWFRDKDLRLADHAPLWEALRGGEVVPMYRPWEAGPDVLGAADVRLGESYPWPVVDHRRARARYLSAARRHLGLESGAREPHRRSEVR